MRLNVLGLVLLAGCLCAVACGVFWKRWHRTEDTACLRGERIAREQGCFACHGADGQGGVADPGARQAMIPSWDGMVLATYARDVGELKEWILDGSPARLRREGVSPDPKALVPMPAYRRLLDEAQTKDLVAYLQMISGFAQEIPEAAYEGRKVAGRLGCFGCHGQGGIGGASNPGSFKGHIPAWDGEEFAELVKDDDELMEWILVGYPKRLWDNPLGRHFLEGQLIRMPGYRAQLSADDQARLLAYFHWLRSRETKKETHEDSHRVMGVLTGWKGCP